MWNPPRGSAQHSISTFRPLCMPLRLSAVPPLPPAPREQSARRIIVMDDDALIRETVGALLDLLG